MSPVPTEQDPDQRGPRRRFGRADHTYESFGTSFPDGRVTTCLSRETRRRGTGFWEKVQAGRAAEVEAHLPGARSLEITRAYVRACFDQHLRGEPQVLLDGPSPRFPEVTFCSP